MAASPAGTPTWLAAEPEEVGAADSEDDERVEEGPELVPEPELELEPVCVGMVLPDWTAAVGAEAEPEPEPEALAVAAMEAEAEEP
jgi:hypothetical protein